MANFASSLKAEITRLARKEVRSETEILKKASAAYRSDIAALKRQVVALEKQLGRLEKKVPTKATLKGESEANGKVRFSAKGLATHRQRLGLTAGELGTLLGVSAQSVYLWESSKTKPRQQQLAAIAALRKTGKREAQAQLEKQTT